MHIITDNRKFAEKILGFNPVWRDALKTDANSILLQSLFTDKTYCTQSNIFSDWNYLFIVKHAHSSQYQLLTELAGKDIDLSDRIICLAGSGDNFKGQRDRKWVSLEGNIHLSIFFKPNQPIDYFHVGFTILTAISVIQTIDQIPELKDKAAIKWVNDIIINNAKVSGVLAHTLTQGPKVTEVILGIGLNVESEPHFKTDLFVHEATALKRYVTDSTQLKQSHIISNLLNSLMRNYDYILNGRYTYLLNIYKNRSVVLGKNIIVYSDPINGKPEIIDNGKVTSIGNNLELYLDNKTTPVLRGRAVLV